jgi:hypothetical protein
MTHNSNCCRHVLVDIVLKTGSYWLRDPLAIKQKALSKYAWKTRFLPGGPLATALVLHNNSLISFFWSKVTCCVFFIDSQTAIIVNVGPANQTMIAQWCGTPANQSKYQVTAEMHIYPNILPSIIYLCVISKTKMVAFFSGTPCRRRGFWTWIWSFAFCSSD